MNPSNKSKEIENCINKSFNVNRKGSILSNLCIAPPIGCGQPAIDFKDELSRKEYSISGLCQKCQDSIFGYMEEENNISGR